MANENENKEKQEISEKQETPETQETTETEPNMVELAQKTAESLKQENERMEANIRKLEEMKAYSVLGGNSDAGKQREEKKEETPQEYKDRILKGKL
jgi:hypothetical protein